jgi:hypothetical protein
VASYKFALVESLLELAPTEKTEISFEELADPHSRHLCEHLKTAPKQVTSRSSQFLDAFHVEAVTLTIKADEEKYHNTF